MDSQEYQLGVGRTLLAVPDRATYSNEEQLLIWQALQLMIISGQFLEHIKKGIFHQHGLKEEILTTSGRQLLHLGRALRDYRLGTEVPAAQIRLTPEHIMQLWCVIGLGGEAAEVAEVISQLITGSTDEILSGRSELGDTQWYLAALCTKLGFTLDEVMQANLAKLDRRYKRGYTAEESRHRVV